MSRRHQSKTQREARRVRQATRKEHLRTSGTTRNRTSFCFTARGGLKIDFAAVGPVVHFDPTTDKPSDLPALVTAEAFRQITDDTEN